MPEEEITVVNNVKLEKKTITDVDGLYQHLKGWFEEEGYKLKEIEYTDITAANGKKASEIYWEAEKDETPYIRYFIKISFNIFNATRVQIQKGNRKVGLDNCQMIIRIASKVILDPDDKLKKDLLASLLKYYHRKKIRGRIDHHVIELYKKTYSLQSEVKNFLNMYPV
ncbi:MAG: hypothetical protein HYS32_00420 [Candidatus Woesearchaeota archaeon]|nr:MAG: hypothetical protein HYS32_00420 [Candidatus Woesearchaeota archaeon]